MLDKNEHIRWLRDDGDNYHNLNYNLNENSIIMDIGGYKGIWVEQMVNKYNPHVYILEPIPSFYEDMIVKFSNNNKVHLMNVAIGTENKSGLIYMNGDETSSNLNNGKSIKVNFNTIDTILEKWNLNKIDLIQINIEGDEYALLEHMLETGSINKFKNIQIQFHLGIQDDIKRRNEIRNGLTKNNFAVKFDYAFVWESWYKIN